MFHDTVGPASHLNSSKIESNLSVMKAKKVMKTAQMPKQAWPKQVLFMFPFAKKLCIGPISHTQKKSELFHTGDKGSIKPERFTVQTTITLNKFDAWLIQVNAAII